MTEKVPKSPYILIDKPLGLTSYQAIEAFRAQNLEYEGVKLGYVGRLDPLATGVLVVLVGDENKNQEPYINLDKRYEVDMALGLATDSHDLLGLVSGGVGLGNDGFVLNEIEDKTIDRVLGEFCGEIEQEYPIYSSVRVQGHPLFWWTKMGRLDEIVIPKKKRTIYSIERIGAFERLSATKLQAIIEERVQLVQGDFRQAEILNAWRDFFAKLANTSRSSELQVVRLAIHCSSGTYIRGLVDAIGQRLGCGAMIVNLRRTAVGAMKI